MPLSTSNSELSIEPVNPPASYYRRAIAATVIALALLLTGLEVASRKALVRVSRIGHRIADDFKNEKGIRPGTRPNVLMLGNSLLLEGMDYPKIRTDVSPDFNVIRYVIESTDYLDWYYGIRRILNEGSRPDMIILCMAPLQVISNRIRGDYAAFYLYQARDLLDISKGQHYSTTQASNLLFAHYSFFYASRNNLRNLVINTSYPKYAEVLHDLQRSPGVWPAAGVIQSTAEPRIRALNAECARYRIPFVLVIAPARTDAGEAEVLEAGLRAKTPVSIPIPGGILKGDMFSDGYHLNQQGAAIFTQALEERVRKWVSELPKK